MEKSEQQTTSENPSGPQKPESDDFGLEVVELEGAEGSKGADGETVFFRSTTTCSTSTC